jgi:hypothetical protein
MIKACRFLLLATILASAPAMAQDKGKKAAWQDQFDLKSCNLVTTGKNPYFILEPRFQLVLEGGGTRLEVTVLDETKVVDGVTTRVVEEREWKKGVLYEVARNYFAMCEQTKDVYYFGEDVDFYENGKVVKHDGTWHAGKDGNRAGLIMPGTPKKGMKYYQEIAPKVAMDRAEIVSLTDRCKVPAGTFDNCLKVKEGSALEPTVTEYKYYAPGIGLVRDEDLKLIKYGFTKE